MKEKELYEAPVVECYEIKLERRPLMASPDGKWDNSIKGGSSWGDTNADYGMEGPSGTI